MREPGTTRRGKCKQKSNNCFSNEILMKRKENASFFLNLHFHYQVQLLSAPTPLRLYNRIFEDKPTLFYPNLFWRKIESKVGPDVKLTNITSEIIKIFNWAGLVKGLQ